MTRLLVAAIPDFHLLARQLQGTEHPARLSQYPVVTIPAGSENCVTRHVGDICGSRAHTTHEVGSPLPSSSDMSSPDIVSHEHHSDTGTTVSRGCGQDPVADDPCGLTIHAATGSRHERKPSRRHCRTSGRVCSRTCCGESPRMLATVSMSTPNGSCPSQAPSTPPEAVATSTARHIPSR